MTRYQLDTFGFNVDCDSFTRGYIEAMWFADVDHPNAETSGMAPRDLTDASKARIIFECARFQRANRELLAHVDAAAAGRDFWYSRRGERNVYLTDNGELEYV